MTAVTAHVTTLRQVDRIKATAVGKTYELTLTKQYVSKWGLPQAIRELIQNALDSDSPFKYEFRQTNKGESSESWVLILNSEFATLTPQTLLLGHTSKADDADTIGSFGEGYKLALLVLTRLGYDVDMFNGDVLWRPRFRYSRTFGEELLVVDESFLADKTNKGLTVMVWGLSEQDKEAIIASCIRMQDSIGAIKQTKYGDILLERKGQLYVGDLFICETDLHFGYNIKPMYITLERDRQTVSNWDLKAISSKCWIATGEDKRVAEMISLEIPDVTHITYDAPELIKEECYRIFRKKHPDALIAQSPAEAAKKIEGSLIETVYAGSGMYNTISTYSPYRTDQERIPALRQRTPQQVLIDFRDSYRALIMDDAMAALEHIIEQAAKWSRD